MNLNRFERHPLTFGPSPIHPLRRLTEYLGGAEIWAKREDVSSGLAFGGNKTRKLEYFLPDVFAQGCDTLVSIGGVQSNHTRQVAAVAAATGLKCRLAQEAWVEWPDMVYDRVGNILLTRIMDANVELVNAGFDIGFRESCERALDEVRAAGGKPSAIPAGGSNHRLGGLGFVNFAMEVQRQERELGIFFDHIIVCTVTGSPQAGMIVGFAGQDRPCRIIGIDASAKPDATRSQVKKIAQNTADLVELGRDITDEDVIIDERFAGELYGVPVESTLRAMRLAGQLEGMLTDPVYEGKSMDGLIGLIQNGEIPKEAKVLYVHLGGAPALSAYASLFKHSQPVKLERSQKMELGREARRLSDAASPHSGLARERYLEG